MVGRGRWCIFPHFQKGMQDRDDFSFLPLQQPAWEKEVISLRTKAQHAEGRGERKKLGP